MFQVTQSVGNEKKVSIPKATIHHLLAFFFQFQKQKMLNRSGSRSFHLFLRSYRVSNTTNIKEIRKLKVRSKPSNYYLKGSLQ